MYHCYFLKDPALARSRSVLSLDILDGTEPLPGGGPGVAATGAARGAAAAAVGRETGDALLQPRPDDARRGPHPRSNARRRLGGWPRPGRHLQY